MLLLARQTSEKRKLKDGSHVTSKTSTCNREVMFVYLGTPPAIATTRLRWNIISVQPAFVCSQGAFDSNRNLQCTFCGICLISIVFYFHYV